MTVILEAEHLTKSFGGVRVVDDLSVSLVEGEALGVVGPNGAGKTTMLNLLTGIDPCRRRHGSFSPAPISLIAVPTSAATPGSAAPTRSPGRSKG